MAEINSFSEGLDAVLEALRPYNNQAGEASFPRHADLGGARRIEAQSLRQWFENVSDTVCRGHPERIALEENIAVLAKVCWRENKRLFDTVAKLVQSPTLSAVSKVNS